MELSVAVVVKNLWCLQVMAKMTSFAVRLANTLQI